MPRLPQSDASPFSALPTEILSLISSFFPLSRRLSVLAVLSKRWRTAVLRSVTLIKVYHARDLCRSGNQRCDFARSVSFFPALNTLLLLPCPLNTTPISLPMSLTHLTVYAQHVFGDDSPPSEFLPPYPPLASLQVLSEGGEDLVPLLVSCASQLTSFQLMPLFAVFSDKLSTFLRDNRMPSLKELHLSGPYHTPFARIKKNNAECLPNLNRFLIVHGPQLTSLNLVAVHTGGVYFAETWSSIPLPNLEQLTLTLWQQAEARHMAGILKNCPQLSDFRCDGLPCLSQVQPQSLLSSLRELSPRIDVPLSFEIIQPYLPSLRTISCVYLQEEEGSVLLRRLLDARQGHLVNSIFYARNGIGAEMIPEALRQCSRLDALSFFGLSTDPFADLNLTLLKLRRLHVDFRARNESAVDLDFVVRALNNAMQRCPRLSAIDVDLPPASERHLATIRGLLDEFDRRQIAQVTIITSDSNKALLAPLVSGRWTKITLTNNHSTHKQSAIT